MYNFLFFDIEIIFGCTLQFPRFLHIDSLIYINYSKLYEYIGSKLSHGIVNNKLCFLKIENLFHSAVTSSCLMLNEFYDEHEVTIENFRLLLLRD